MKNFSTNEIWSGKSQHWQSVKWSLSHPHSEALGNGRSPLCVEARWSQKQTLEFTETFPRQQLLSPVKTPRLLIKPWAAHILMSEVPQTCDRLIDVDGTIFPLC